MTDRAITEIPLESHLKLSATSCALQCQTRIVCKLFQYNKITKQCDLYDGEGYKAVERENENRFYQRMPDGCVAGRDEWFPEYQSCIWIHTESLPYEEAKQRCESGGKMMMEARNITQMQTLMNLLDLKWIHVLAFLIKDNTYEWNDGSLVSHDWCPNQPSENTGCIGVDLTNWCPSGGLDDYPCTDERTFFCV
ncbi:C-type mannose receptor 2-like [Saccostrea cucullata]|uniref:C-type mannose receptor 2-like n=1 Tax=Saccostrea cuccullata TaxID=36930 RepID=UPI002ECFE717